jgi:hypothetical protein
MCTDFAHLVLIPCCGIQRSENRMINVEKSSKEGYGSKGVV